MKRTNMIIRIMRMPPGRITWLLLSLEHDVAPTTVISHQKHTLWPLMGTLSKISERSERSSAGRQNSGKCNVLVTLGRRGGRRPLRHRGEADPRPHLGAQNRMLHPIYPNYPMIILLAFHPYIGRMLLWLQSGAQYCANC